MIWMLWGLALAIEPGAAKGAFSSDCACLEVQPGVHANRHSTTWVPIPSVTHLEYLEVANKPLLSAVIDGGGRVSLAERDDIPPAIGRVRTVGPELEVLDQNSGNPTRSVAGVPITPPAVHLYLGATTERRIDAAAIGRALRSRESALAACVPGEQSTAIDLKVSGGGSLSPKAVDDSEAGACVAKALKGLKASVSQKAPGTVQFTIAR